MSKHHAWDKPGARSVSWSDDPCLCKDLMGDSTLRYCPACSGAAPDMAEELARQKALIATYERDRTRHLLLIEGADTDLAELGESLGEEIEALKADNTMLLALVVRSEKAVQPGPLWRELRAVIERATP